VTDPSNVHSAVLRASIQEYLSYEANAIIVDATVGHGGHARDLGARLGAEGHLIGLDVDACGLAVARRRLA